MVSWILWFWLVLATTALPFVNCKETEIASYEDDAETYCKGFTCIRKCCPQNTYINITRCDRPSSESSIWKPTFYNSQNLQPEATPPKNLKYLYGVMKCDSFPLQPYIYPDDAFYLLEDGTLLVPLYGITYDTNRYCIDEFAVSINESEEMALLCFEDESQSKPNDACKVVKKYIYPLLIMVSCVFLTITLFVYICIPELRGKLHGQCLLSLVSSLLVAYITIFVVTLASRYMQPTFCLICASVRHITLLASFFWLNVMCFDIWRALSSMRPASETSAKSKKRFIRYSIYAWGSSIVIGLVAIIVENLPSTSENLIRPVFVNNQNSCWFVNKKAHWYYLYMEILVLLIINTGFFIHVIYIIFKSQNNPALQEARSRNRDRMWLYGRLFLVMGINWITEVISWQQGTCEAWILTDIINALQGFSIFLVFVCKKSTRQKVVQRFSRRKNQKSSRSTLSASSLPDTRSTVLNTERRTEAHPAESHRLMETPSLLPTSNERQMAAMNEETMNPNATVNNHIFHAEIDEDCPSVKGDSDTSDEVAPPDEGTCDLREELQPEEETGDDTCEQLEQPSPKQTEILENNAKASYSVDSLQSTERTELTSEEPEGNFSGNVLLPSGDEAEVDSEMSQLLTSVDRKSGPTDDEVEIVERESSPLLGTTQERYDSPAEHHS